MDLAALLCIIQALSQAENKLPPGMLFKEHHLQFPFMYLLQAQEPALPQPFVKIFHHKDCQKGHGMESKLGKFNLENLGLKTDMMTI